MNEYFFGDHYWTDAYTLIAVDGQDDPPKIYIAEMLAVQYNFISFQQLSKLARERENGSTKSQTSSG